MLTKAEIKFIKSLRERQSRTLERLFIAQGDKLISELLKSQLPIRCIYCTSSSQLADIPRKTEVVEINATDMERLSSLTTAPASLAVVEMPIQQDITRISGLTIVLDGVQDPGNIGTIIRLADWFGITQIYCSADCADCFAPKVVQATMGAIGTVSVIYTDLHPLLEKYKDEGVPIYGTFLEKSDNIYTQNLTNQPNAIVVMGSEGRGISPSIENLINHRLHIPSFSETESGTESLNVGVATAIVVSEFKRQ